MDSDPRAYVDPAQTPKAAFPRRFVSQSLLKPEAASRGWTAFVV
jgi:hypothetical protein